MTRRQISPLHITLHPFWLFSSKSIHCHFFFLILCFLKACYLILAFMMTETQTPFLSAFSSLELLCVARCGWWMWIRLEGIRGWPLWFVKPSWVLSQHVGLLSDRLAGRTEPHTYAHIKSSFISHITAADQCPEKGMRRTNLERRLNATLLLNESDLSPSLAWESLLKITYLESFILYVLKSFN